MNCIKYLRDVPNIEGKDLIIYFYILSRCTSKESCSEDYIYSFVTQESIRKTFSLNHEESEEVVEKLYQAGLIGETDIGELYVGYMDERNYILFNEDDSEEGVANFLDKIITKSEDFIQSARRPTSKSLARAINEDLLLLTKIKDSAYSVPNLLTLFKRSCEIEMQEEYRTFDKGEAGAMKKILNKLGSKKLIGVILAYVDNFSKWGDYPNIYNMVKNQDSVYGKVSKAKIVESSDEGFA